MQFFEELGLIGLFLVSFLAATILPFSSEAILAIMVSDSKSLISLLVVASLGNILGGMFNYYIGHLGKLSWAEKYLKITKRDIDKWCIKIERFGSILAFFCWLPVIGDPLALALGYFRVSPLKVLIYLSLGKTLRYGVVIYLLT